MIYARKISVAMNNHFKMRFYSAVKIGAKPVIHLQKNSGMTNALIL